MRNAFQRTAGCFAAICLLLTGGCGSAVTESRPPAAESSRAETAETTSRTAAKPMVRVSDGDALLTLSRSAIDLDEENYQTLLHGIAAGDTTIEFSESIHQDEISDMVQRINFAHPELFWFTSWKTTMGSSHSSAELHRMSECTDIPAMSAALESAVQDVLAQVPEGLDDFGKALFVHDYLVTHTQYDSSGYNAENVTLNGTAYGCLVQHSAVCSGYARAYQLLMQHLGFDCGYCTGEMLEGDSHAWNYLKLGDAYYWVDVTHDDPVNLGENVPVSHAYFLIDDALLLRTRRIDEGQPFLPECTTMEGSYFQRQGAYLAEYSREQVADILARSTDTCCAEIMFQTEDALHAATDDLFSEDGIWEIPAVNEGSGSVHYLLSQEMYVLCIEF